MGVDNNRLLLLWEKTLRDVNRDVINPEFAELRIDDLKPVIETVAKARAGYLKELFDIAGDSTESLPSEERIRQLKQHRERYEELSAASRALEVAIERGYLDVES